MTWQTLGSVAPRSLVEARLQLHWAAQVLGAAADGYLPHQSDDSHTAMDWRDGALVGKTGVTLRVHALELVAAGQTLALDGTTLAAAMEWTSDRLGGGRVIRVRDYDMPMHPVGTDRAKFQRGPIADALAELARYFGSASELLAHYAPCVVWPHHFDLGGTIALGSQRELGIGMSPGDRSYAEPYLYVTPPQIKPGATMPPLAGGGHWSTQFVGAVLTNLMLAGEPGARAFVEAAITGIRAIVS